MGVIAHNVANVCTDQFKKSRAVLTEGPNESVQAEIERSGSQGYPAVNPSNIQTDEKEPSNVDLAEEIPKQFLLKAGIPPIWKRFKLTTKWSEWFWIFLVERKERLFENFCCLWRFFPRLPMSIETDPSNFPLKFLSCFFYCFFGFLDYFLDFKISFIQCVFSNHLKDLKYRFPPCVFETDTRRGKPWKTPM